MHRSIMTVMFGSVSSQCVMLVAMTYAAQSLGPADFGFYAMVFAFAAPIGIVATLRLETTFIFLSESSKVVLAVLAAFLCLLLITVVVGFLGGVLFGAKGLYVTALAFLLGGNAIVINLSNYRGRYWLLALVRMMVSVVTLISIIFFAEIELPHALVWAAIFGQLAGFIMGSAGHFSWMNNNFYLRNARGVGQVIRDSVSFSVFNGVQSLFSTLQETFVVVLINHFLGAASVGFYSLSQRLLRAPISVASEAIGRVLQVRVRVNMSEDCSLRKSFMGKVLFLLFLGAVCLAVCIIFLAPSVAQLALGADWQGLIDLLPAMGGYMAALFVASTIAVFPLAVGKPKAIAFLGVAGTLLYVCLVYFSLWRGMKLEQVYWVVSVAMPMYFLFFSAKVRKIVTR